MLYYYFISNALFPKVLDPKEIWRSGRKTAFSIVSSVQISHSVVRDSLRPQGPQYARLPCPSPSPEICSNSCLLSQWCHPLLLLPSVFPSIRVFSKESALRIRWPKYWSFSISPLNEYSGLISFRTGWFYLLVSPLADISACLRGFLVMWFRYPFSKIPKALSTRIFSKQNYYPCLFSIKTEPRGT